MSAMLIANSPPLLKQPVHRTPPKTGSKSKPVSSQQKQQPKGNPEVKPEVESKPPPEPTVETKLEPNLELVPAILLCTESGLSNIEEPEKPAKKVPQTLPSVMTESEEEGGGGTEEEDEGVAVPVVVPVGRGRRKKANSNKFVNIPSIEYPVSCWQGRDITSWPTFEVCCVACGMSSVWLGTIGVMFLHRYTTPQYSVSPACLHWRLIHRLIIFSLAVVVQLQFFFETVFFFRTSTSISFPAGGKR